MRISNGLGAFAFAPCGFLAFGFTLISRYHNMQGCCRYVPAHW